MELQTEKDLGLLLKKIAESLDLSLVSINQTIADFKRAHRENSSIWEHLIGSVMQGKIPQNSPSD